VRAILVYLFLLLALPIHADESPQHTHAVDSSSINSIIRLAATTSAENSGLLAHLLPRFTEQFPYEIELTSVASGKALRLARTGKVDVVMVQSPAAEKKFVDEGYGINRQAVMRNDFILAGPDNDPARLSSATNTIEAFQMIAANEASFISRGDDSGTNKKELLIWDKAGFDPYGADWYIETGTGMADSLKTAEQEGAYILIDRATFLVRSADRLEILVEDPINLSNRYNVIMVNPEKNAGVNHDGARDLISWLCSDNGHEAIVSYTPKGQQLYIPVSVMPGLTQ
jgi:tungstate transport system substrate-binding protein